MQKNHDSIYFNILTKQIYEKKRKIFIATLLQLFEAKSINLDIVP